MIESCGIAGVVIMGGAAALLCVCGVGGVILWLAMAGRDAKGHPSTAVWWNHSIRRDWKLVASFSMLNTYGFFKDTRTGEFFAAGMTDDGDVVDCDRLDRWCKNSMNEYHLRSFIAEPAEHYVDPEGAAEAQRLVRSLLGPESRRDDGRGDDGDDGDRPRISPNGRWDDENDGDGSTPAPDGGEEIDVRAVMAAARKVRVASERR